MSTDRRARLKTLPRVDDVLAMLENDAETGSVPRTVLVASCRFALEVLRREILESGDSDPPPPTVERAREIAAGRLRFLRLPGLRRVINATGIMIHTNLGRAPLCDDAVEAIASAARGYSNLEYHLDRGKRGLRYDHVKELFALLTGAEEVVVVNNNAAAVLLVLNSLSQGKEAVVSRGELVEIGGEFRIPEIMEKSGAILREVGTTNRTRLSDYERAISADATGVILKVHRSNFTTLGFTEEAAPSDLAALGRRYRIPVIHDLGSGCLVNLGAFGLEPEPTVQEALKQGVDVVTFSGDKLLGGPQAGIILGGGAVMEQIRSNPLNRALRIDKLTLAALEATLRQYLFSKHPEERLPLLRSMLEPVEKVAARAEALRTRLTAMGDDRFSFRLAPGVSLAGGGSLPMQEFPTHLIAVTARHMPSHELEAALRRCDPPIVARIQDDAVLLDVRTLGEDESSFVETALRAVSAGG